MSGLGQRTSNCTDADVNPLTPAGTYMARSIRIGVPEDLWLAVKFVLECDYFNGRTIDVDGGLSF